ncbi:MAG: two-component system cell cycle response regulator [Polyangiales bacterium]|jgi:two-component system cell cycle response regulator
MRNPANAFRVLLDLTRELTEQDLELDDALASVTRAGLRLFDGQHASLRVLDEPGVELLSGARSGAGESERPIQFSRGEGVAGWVVEHRKVARIDDTSIDARFLHFKGQSYQIASLLAIPLWSAGEVVGCLTVTSAKKSHFDEDDEMIGRLLSNCAVPPIDRARLQRIAMTDPQTNALTHGYLRPRLERELAGAKDREYPLSLLLMDLDHFKRVNDSYGHAAGDEVLVAFGHLVQGLVRRDDVFVRRGGEEFVLLMPRCGEDIAKRAAERIRTTLGAEAIKLASGETIHQKVSIGVAEWNREEDAAALEARADAAMYEAKRLGRDRVEISAG